MEYVRGLPFDEAFELNEFPKGQLPVGQVAVVCFTKEDLVDNGKLLQYQGCFVTVTGYTKESGYSVEEFSRSFRKKHLKQYRKEEKNENSGIASIMFGEVQIK